MPNYSHGLVLVLEKVGGPTRLAEQLGIVASAVTQWSKVPARHIPRIEALTGVPGNIIRPDLYTAAKPKVAKRKGKTAAKARPKGGDISTEADTEARDEAA
jgi:DNA-binding transcriptional regulator YdaS (Cro superfamily)